MLKKLANIVHEDAKLGNGVTNNLESNSFKFLLDKREHERISYRVNKYKKL